MSSAGAKGSGKKQRRAKTSKTVKPGKRKRSDLGEHAVEGDAGDIFHHESDEEAMREDEEDGREETAEEKRLRVAKGFLERMKREREVEDEDREGHEDALGDRLRKAADLESGAIFRRVAAGASSFVGGPDACSSSAGRLLRGHRLSPTAVCLTEDDGTAYSVAKDGSILCWDMATLSRKRFPAPNASLLRSAASDVASAAYWVQPAARRGGSRTGLLACSVSSDGRYLAVGGGSNQVLIYDTRTEAHIGCLPGHKDAVSGLSFRRGSTELYSSSFDRSVKIWSVGSMAYVDSLFGHQQEVLCVDSRANERAVTGGMDRSVRFFKIPEESHLVFRARSMATESCAFVTGSQFVTGDQDGAVCLYTNTQKKPIQTIRNAHPTDTDMGPGNCGEACAAWVTAVASARGTDLVASGAGNGIVRLWKTEGEPAKGGVVGLQAAGNLPARGFCNGMAVASSGRFLLAAVGQEPRLGRWARDKVARNGVLLHMLAEGPSVGEDGVERGDDESDD